MRTWSIESAFLKAYATAAALTVQGLIDAAHTVEQMTRPVRHERDGADQLAEREAEIDAHEPDESCPICHASTAVTRVAVPGYVLPICEDCWIHDRQLSDLDDLPTVPGLHNPTDRFCVYTSANGIDTEAICGVCRPVRDIVEQMIEERFPTIPPAVSADARVSAAESGSTPPSPSVACTDPSPTRQSGYTPSLGGEGSLADSGIRKPPARERSRWDDCGGGPW